MSLHLIIGPANAGITHAVHERVVQSAQGGSRALLLVPSEPDVSRAIDHLAPQAPVGIGVHTLDEHLDGLWTVLGDGREIVTPVQRLVMLAESGSRVALQSLAMRAGSHGLVRVLEGLVQRAAESGCPLTLDAGATGPSADILAWTAAYAHHLERAGFIERGAAHRFVCEHLDDTAQPELIAIQGFSGLTPAQEAFVMKVSRLCEITVGLVFDPGVPATAVAAGLAERLSARAAVVRLGARSADSGPAELIRIERSLGDVATGDVAAQGAVALSEAWGGQAEAARIVREVQDALASGMSPGQVAVVFRDVAPHLRDLQTAFDEAGISAEYDVRVPLHATGMGRALLLLMEVCGSEGSYRQLCDVLRSPFSPATDDALDALDAHIRRTHAADAQAAETWLRTHSPQSAAFIGEARRACYAEGGVSAERRWYRLANAMLRRAYAHKPAPGPEFAADAAAVRVFIEAVRSIGALGIDNASSETLALALRETRVALSSGDRPDCVQVMGAERVRGRRYDCVIVGGLTSGEFPRTTAQGVLSAPALIRALEQAGIDPSPRSTVEAERLLFYLVVTRAARKLVLSWRSHDGEGRPIRPSVFLEELLDLYRDPALSVYPSGSPPHHVLGLNGLSAHPEAPRTARRELRAAAAGGALGDHSETAALEEARRRSSRVTPTSSDCARRNAAERAAFSPSEVESYLQCPFRWYVERMVRPRELDERFDRSAAGRLAHEIMKRFYDRFIACSDSPRVTPDSLPLALKVHEQIAREALSTASVITAAEAAAARVTVRQTRRLVEADASFLPGFEPTHTEWSFGTGDEDPEPFGDFSLAGRIDRIDTRDGRLVVTDYKLGASTSRRGVGKFEAEGIVQLPLYAAVASRRLGLAVAGGLYRPLGGGKPRGFVEQTLDSADLVRTDVIADGSIGEVIDAAIVRAAGAVERMRAGDIFAQPRGGSCPSYCPVRGFCTEWSPGRG